MIQMYCSYYYGRKNLSHVKYKSLNFFSVEVLATLTSDVGRILSKLHQVQPNGKLCLITGIRIAHVCITYLTLLKYICQTCIKDCKTYS